MTNPTRVTHGTTAVFSVTFFDEDGDAMDPDTARLYVRQGDDRDDFALSEESGSVWTYELQTENYHHGLMDWTVRATGGTIKIVKGGILNIIAEY